MYLAVIEAIVSSIMCSIRNEKMMQVHYVSHVLEWAEIRYSPLKKHIFNLVISARKLKPDFQAHPVVVLTNVPLRQVMHKPDLTGRMTKWVLELSDYQISFQSRCSF